MRYKPKSTFSIYICKVLKQFYPDVGMSKKGVTRRKPSFSHFFRYRSLYLSF